MYALPDNRLKTEILTYTLPIDSITQPNDSITYLLFNPIITFIQIFLKKLIRHIFRINYYFGFRKNRSKLHAFISFVLTKQDFHCNLTFKVFNFIL